MIPVKYNPAHTCIHHGGKEQKVTGALMEPDGWKLFLQLTFSGAEEPPRAARWWSDLSDRVSEKREKERFRE